MKSLIAALALLVFAFTAKAEVGPPATPEPVCVTAAEYITMRHEDFHGANIPAPGDHPGIFELEQWRFNFHESFYFVDKYDLPFQAERVSFYATKGGKTMIIAAYWSGCLVIAVEVSAADAAQIMLHVKGQGLK